MNATVNDAGRARKFLLTALVVGGLSALVGLGTYSAFTATTTNSGNNISSGTVKIDQHTGAVTLYNVTNQKPGDSIARCLRINYSGSLTATAVKLYASSGITNGSQYNLQIERGSGLSTLDGTMSCAGFSSSSTAYNGNLDSLGTSYAGASTARRLLQPGRPTTRWITGSRSPRTTTRRQTLTPLSRRAERTPSPGRHAASPPAQDFHQGAAFGRPLSLCGSAQFPLDRRTTAKA